MAILITGKTWVDGDQASSANLNQAVNSATFDSDAVDGVTTELTGGSIGVRAGGVDSSQLADDAVVEAKISDGAVTSSKLAPLAVDGDKVEINGLYLENLQKISSMSALGNSGLSSGDVSQIDINDEDDMASDSDTSLATQQSIKAYIDSKIEGPKAWASYNGVVDTINASNNVASITRSSTGVYDIVFTTSLVDQSYAVTLSYSNEVNVMHGVGFISNITSSGFRISFFSPANSANTMDKSLVQFAVHR